MYNHYIPQSDGSFRRSRMPDVPDPASRDRNSVPSAPPAREGPPFAFLQRLLPGGFDFGDLAIVFLLLLMAGDSKENRSNALLTIALYFIL